MTALAWWQRGVIYQVYPRSFQDDNGDGVGDLAGITRRLPYLAQLGIEVVWISPIYPSPMADFGYDVSNYCDVDPLFGSLEDVDILIARAHALGLKVLLDYVPNHTSTQHPWFVESRSSRDNPKRDWYLWRDPASDGGPPNNWLSRMGGSAWQPDIATGQSYYHAFLKEQPDLNWRNPDVREAMLAVLRFWLDRGVDGFRVDVLWLLIKDAAFRDNPPNPDYKAGEPEHHALLQTYTEDQPEVHDIVRSMRDTLNHYGERLLIGEIYLPVEQLVTYYGHDGDGANMPFNFALITAPWNASGIAAYIRDYERALPAGAWPNWVLGNHDNPRVATRIGQEQARAAAVLLLTLRGTPTIYYGDELGMLDSVIPSNAIQDPAELRQPGIGQGRDPERTPMRWDASANAGFTDGAPWLPIGDVGSINEASESSDNASMLSLYRRLLAFRRAHPALVAGTIDNVQALGDVLTYERCLGEDHLYVAMNLGNSECRICVPSGAILLCTDPSCDGTVVRQDYELRAGEAIIVRADGRGARALNGMTPAFFVEYPRQQNSFNGATVGHVSRSISCSSSLRRFISRQQRQRLRVQLN